MSIHNITTPICVYPKLFWKNVAYWNKTCTKTFLLNQTNYVMNYNKRSFLVPVLFAYSTPAQAIFLSNNKYKM